MLIRLTDILHTEDESRNMMIRVMWMSMKSLNPQSGTPVFPKPQKADPKTVKTVKAKPAKR